MARKNTDTVVSLTLIMTGKKETVDELVSNWDFDSVFTEVEHVEKDDGRATRGYIGYLIHSGPMEPGMIEEFEDDYSSECRAISENGMLVTGAVRTPHTEWRGSYEDGYALLEGRLE